MKKLFCFLLAVVFLAAAAWCVDVSYHSYVSPLPEGFTVYAPFQRKVFDLRYDKIAEISISGYLEWPDESSRIEKVFDPKNTPDELKAWVDYFNEYRYTSADAIRDFRADWRPPKEPQIWVRIKKWTGEYISCAATADYLRVGKHPTSDDKKAFYKRFRGTIGYYGDTSPLFEAICS